MKADKCKNCGKYFMIYDKIPEKCSHCGKDLKQNPFQGTGFEDLFASIFWRK